MTDQTPYVAKIEKKHVISSIWFLPFIAALLGGWILVQHILHSNSEIKIHFDSADSIVVNKTKVRYKGVIVGTVTRIELDKENGVNVITEIENQAAYMLRENTQFWLVYPKASLTSISGLDTLFSGSYINLKPGDGEQNDVFRALKDQPINIPDNALLINLESDNAGSISVGTPIFFKKIKVGEVAQISLDDEQHGVSIKAYVENKYSHLIKQNSKFWNISGLQANISRAGVDLKLDSLSTLIAGGITFSSPTNSTAITATSHFKLFDNIDSTAMGLSISLSLKNITNLPKGAGILFKGLGIGHITEINYASDKKVFIATAVINPQFSDLVTKGAQFWLEKTSVSFSNIANLGNILTGDYISFLPSTNATNKKTVQTKFVVLDAQRSTLSTLTLNLKTDNASGLNAGAPISYQGIKIGNISRLGFSDNGKFIRVELNIDKPYQYLINKHSQFYRLSGINLKASLKGIKVQTSPLENILSGGIGLYNKKAIAKNTKQTHLSKKHLFHLYPSKEMATFGKNVFTKPLSLSLLSKDLPSVSEGSPVYYHKFPIGEVTSFAITNSTLIQTNITIKQEYKHLINENSVFWNISGFKVDAGISGIKVQADSLLSIASGGIAVELGNKDSTNKYINGDYKLFDNYRQATEQSQAITILFDQAYDLRVGSKIRMKGLVVGQITALIINQQGKVQATAELNAAFSQKIAHKGSRFWIISSDISLSGAKHLSTLVSGVYLNVQPGNGEATTQFEGESTPPAISEDKIGLPIILLADNAGSTDIGSPVYHRQIQIGEVVNKQLTNNTSGVEITLNIYPEYARLIRNNSIFWPASGFNLNVGITGVALKSTSLNSLVKGGINMSTTDARKLQPASLAYTRFALEKEVKDEWLKWKLVIPN